jgi:hypothetical protein
LHRGFFIGLPYLVMRMLLQNLNSIAEVWSPPSAAQEASKQ